jgi:hypothetical protein
MQPKEVIGKPNHGFWGLIELALGAHKFISDILGHFKISSELQEVCLVHYIKNL